MTDTTSAGLQDGIQSFPYLKVPQMPASILRSLEDLSLPGYRKQRIKEQCEKTHKEAIRQRSYKTAALTSSAFTVMVVGGGGIKHTWIQSGSVKII